MLGLILAWLPSLGQAAPEPAQPMVILTVDADRLESGLPLYTKIAQQAEALRAKADAQRRSQIDLAVELRRSEILTALPDAIAAVAQEAKADLVLDIKVAERIGEATARDVTEEVQQRIEQQFSAQTLEINP